MTRSAVPLQPEVAESTASELQALYREAAQAEPDALLDHSILDAARAELRSAGAAKARRTSPWWKGWVPAASALAIALVGLSLTWRVMDQQERELHQEMKAAEGIRERSLEAPSRAVPAQDAAQTQPMPRAPAPLAEKSRRAEPAALGDAPAASVPEPAAMPAPAAPAPLVPAVGEEAAKKSAHAEKEERRDTSAAAGTAPSPARQAGKLEAGGAAIGSIGASEATSADALAGPSTNATAKSLASPPSDPATPEAWLKQVRELRAAGRHAEAAQSLARFRARYPDFAVPDDLLKLK